MCGRKDGPKGSGLGWSRDENEAIGEVRRPIWPDGRIRRPPWFARLIPRKA